MCRYRWQRQLAIVVSSGVDAARAKAAKTALAVGRTRRDSCYMALRAMDTQLSLIGCPLSRFVAGSVSRPATRPLQLGETRGWRDWPAFGPLPGESMPHRAVIKDTATGKCRYEVPVWVGDRRP